MQELPPLIFTFDQFVLLEQALVPFELMLLNQTEPHPNTQFALATVTQLRAKVTIMMNQGIWGEVGGFDENELLILRSAVWIVLAAFDAVIPSAEGEQLKRHYQTLQSILVPGPRQKRERNEQKGNHA